MQALPFQMCVLRFVIEPTSVCSPGTRADDSDDVSNDGDDAVDEGGDPMDGGDGASGEGDGVVLTVVPCLAQGKGRAEFAVTTFWGELENRDSEGGGRLPWTGSHVEC